MNIKKNLFLIIIFYIAGCTVGNNYKKPEIALPENFKSANTTAKTADNSGLSSWWKRFNDPVLDLLISTAIKSNNDIALAKARISEVRALYNMADSNNMPAASAFGSYSRNRESENAGIRILGKTNYDLYQAGFDATWEIDIFGGLRREVEAASGEMEASVEGLRYALITLTGEVARNYTELRGLQRQLSLTSKILNIYEDKKKLIKGRYEAGIDNYIEVVKAENLVYSSRSDIIEIEKGIKRYIHRLGVLLADDSISLEDKLPEDYSYSSKEIDISAGLPSDLLKRRPDIRKVERELAAESARIGAATADLFPRFSLTGSFGLKGNDPIDLFDSSSLFWGFGPSIRLPILRTNRIKSNILMHEARYEQIFITYKETVLTAIEEAENAIFSYSKGILNNTILAENYSTNLTAAHMYNDLYKNGLINMLELSDAEELLIKSEKKLAESETAVSLNMIALYKAIGGGWEEKLK